MNAFTKIDEWAQVCKKARNTCHALRNKDRRTVNKMTKPIFILPLKKFTNKQKMVEFSSIEALFNSNQKDTENVYVKQERRKKLGELGFQKLRFRLGNMYKIENTVKYSVIQYELRNIYSVQSQYKRLFWKEVGGVSHMGPSSF